MTPAADPSRRCRAIACLIAAPFVLNPSSINPAVTTSGSTRCGHRARALTRRRRIVSFGRRLRASRLPTAWVTAVNGYSPCLAWYWPVVLPAHRPPILGS